LSSRVWTAILGLWLCAPCAATAQAPDGDRKQAMALRVPDGTIRLDGRLDEEVWLHAVAVTDFAQKEPTEGAAPSDPTDVRLVFDGDGLYIGARMSSASAPDIQAPLARRDSVGQAEYILVILDTYLDRRTAAAFGVTASGVRIDRAHPRDSEDGFDSGFDPVWEAEVSRIEGGWTAELWIPFSQLRFNRENEQTWGLNISRFRPNLQEEDYWVMVPRTESVFISRFGNLRGIEGIRPTRRIELLPYMASGASIDGSRNLANPFDDGRNLTGRVGVDMKLGLGPNLTLEATVNPDFGQVEADPAEVNLTAFATRFPEKRPFFLEGSQLFSINHPNFYYSRRIGARPTGTATGDFVDYPQDATILAAAKITGRLQSKTAIGVQTAVTGEEHARVAGLGVPGTLEIPVAPRAYYGLGRVRQEFGTLGSTYGFLVNTMHRDLADGDPLANLLSRNALAAAGDTLMRFKGGEYELRAVFGGSLVTGTPEAITRVQRTSSHYAQRPDRTYSPLDPTLTSLGGWSLQTNFERTSGRHWLWGVNTKADSENFETNDIANLNGADGVIIGSNIRYRETRPGRIFRAYTIGLNQSNDSTLRFLRQAGSLRPSVNLTWANFWTTSWSVTRNLPTQSVSLTRGGPLMAGPAAWSTSFNIANRSTSQTRWSGSATVSEDEEGGSITRVSGSFSFRPGPRWQLSAGPSVERHTDTQQYVTTMSGGRHEIYDTRYIFAFIERSTVATEFRMSLTLKPDVNLDVYAEPFAASGHYYDYGELLLPGGIERLKYGTNGTGLVVNPDGSQTVTAGSSTFNLRNRDFNTLSFRSNVVLRWEWRPGSTLYLVWQQDRSETETLGDYVNVGDMFRSVAAPGRNSFVVKTSFWIPVK
jgi:hypothetical protein